MLTSTGPLEATLTAAAVELPGDPPLFMVTIAPAGADADGSGGPPPARRQPSRPRR